ncbi:hypothetical protein D1872_290230 [compost metagenome]
MNAANTPISKYSALKRSANQPPTGRIKVASAIKPAVRMPASTLVRSKFVTRKFGRYTVKATKEPKVIKYSKEKSQSFSFL